MHPRSLRLSLSESASGLLFVLPAARASSAEHDLLISDLTTDKIFQRTPVDLVDAADVNDGIALFADEMAVGRGVGIVVSPTVIAVDLPNQPLVFQDVEISIDRSEGDFRHGAANLFKDPVRRGVRVCVFDRVVDDSALFRFTGSWALCHPTPQIRRRSL